MGNNIKNKFLEVRDELPFLCEKLEKSWADVRDFLFGEKI